MAWIEIPFTTLNPTAHPLALISPLISFQNFLTSSRFCDLSLHPFLQSYLSLLVPSWASVLRLSLPLQRSQGAQSFWASVTLSLLSLRSLLEVTQLLYARLGFSLASQLPLGTHRNSSELILQPFLQSSTVLDLIKASLCYKQLVLSTLRWPKLACSIFSGANFCHCTNDLKLFYS